jgi:aspartokinase
MEPNRIVVELFLEKPNFKEVLAVSRALEAEGIKPIMMPPEDREINTHLIIEKADLSKAKAKLKKLGQKFVDKEVIIITLENKPGTMAEAASRISSKGINLVYAFSVAMTPNLSYVLLGTADNQAALKALQ